MPPRPTSARTSYDPGVAFRSAASCASAASGRVSMLASVGVATVGPDQRRGTGIPVPQRGQNDAPGPRLVPQRKQAEDGFEVIPTAQDTQKRDTPSADPGAVSGAPWYHATGAVACGRQFQSAHHVEGPLRCYGE